MSTENLAAYLNDHLAGSVAALELLEHLISLHSHQPLGQSLRVLQTDVEQDQGVLKDILAKLGAHESAGKKVAGWFSEKLARIKLGHTEAGDELGLLEALEVLALGIEGKRALWTALALVSPAIPDIQEIDFAELTRRARDQQTNLEEYRLTIASRVLGATQRDAGT